MNLLLFSALLLTPSPRVEQDTPAATTVPVDSSVVLYQGQPVDASHVKFTLERTLCFGECPEYVIEVRGDGRVVWTGKRNVEQKGVFLAWIEPVAVQLLLDRAGDMHDFFAHPVSFDDSGFDGPGCTLALQIAGLEQHADVTSVILRRNDRGVEYADWRMKRDEKDLTNAIDALTESWRWLDTEEKTDEAASARPILASALPADFSIGIRRRGLQRQAEYDITIDATGAGKWVGISHVREIGERTFTVPRDSMLLLASRAQRLVGLGQDITIDPSDPNELRLFVHADGHVPGPRKEIFSPSNTRPGRMALPVDFAKATALFDLVDVIARTSHFTGCWDEQQSAHANIPGSSK